MPTAKVSGAEIYYEEVGEGPPIILSPGGLQGVLEAYKSVLAGLSQQYRVIVYDRRYGGRSRSPLVVQTWDLMCQDVIGLMDTLGIEQAYLGGGASGGAIPLGCAVRYPERVQAVFHSNVSGGAIFTIFLSMKLFKSMHMALNCGIKSVVDVYDRDDDFAPFVPEQTTYDPEYRKALEGMAPEDFAQVMRDTIYALFDDQYVIPGVTKEMLEGIRTPTLVMPGSNDDRHPRYLAEQVHRLVPNSQWAEVPGPHYKAQEKYVQRVLQFLAQVEASS